MSENQGDPTQFILNLKDKTNLLVFYENQDYVKSLETHFLRLGLASGRQSFTFPPKPYKTPKKTTLAGINIDSFKERGYLLQIFSTTAKSKQIKHIIEDFAKNSQKLGSFARIIIHHQNFSSRQYRNLELFEGFLDSLYQKYDVTILDSYDRDCSRCQIHAEYNKNARSCHLCSKLWKGNRNQDKMKSGASVAISGFDSVCFYNVCQNRFHGRTIKADKIQKKHHA